MFSHLNCEHFARGRGAVFCPASGIPSGAFTSGQVALSRLLTNWLSAQTVEIPQNNCHRLLRTYYVPDTMGG